MIKALTCAASIILMLALNAANTYKIDIDELKKIVALSEKDMFYNHGEKSVAFIERVYPSTVIGSSIGQVGGLDTDLNGDLVVFHRGSRRWAGDSFDGSNNFNTRKYGPIKEDVLDLISAKSLAKKETWGSNKFYMPHGINIDHESNVWLTDVAMHQVFKFDFSKSDRPALVIGKAFENGNDASHLCKPAGVDIAKSNGDVFVADGYCNERVVRYDKHGGYIRSYKDNEHPLIIVHSVALIEKLNLVCTVSREEGRIVCFDLESGEKKAELTNGNMKTVYSIEYDPINEVLHAATGENHGHEAVGLTFKASEKDFGKFLQKWNAKTHDLHDTHDLAISPDGSKIYLGQLNAEIDLFSYE